jgi:hypothetical protein
VLDGVVGSTSEFYSGLELTKGMFTKFNDVELEKE